MKSRRHKRSSTGSPSVSHKAANSALVLGNDVKQARGNGSGPPNTKWSWHYRQLRALRERLSQERHQLGEEAKEEHPNYSMSMADAATDELDRDLLLSEVSSEQELLYDVEEALRRIQDDTYGICQMTGKAISGQRLRAVPWARFEVGPQAEVERQGQGARARLGRLGSVRFHDRGNLEASESEEDRPEIPAKDEALRTVSLPEEESLGRQI